MTPLKPKTPSSVRHSLQQAEGRRQDISATPENPTLGPKKNDPQPVFLPKPPAALNLGALDQVDLRILSACLQDSLISVKDFKYLPTEGRFVGMFNRFCWEIIAHNLPEDQRQVYFRTHSALTIERVARVQHRGLDQGICGDWMHLLCLKYTPHDPDETSQEGQKARQSEPQTGYRSPASLGPGILELSFAGGAMIRVWTERLNVTLRDIDLAWPTAKRPGHDLSGIDLPHQFTP